MPAAAGATCVGGQGVHWTCATPAPTGPERIPFIDDAEWEEHLAAAEGLLHVHRPSFDGAPQAAAILERIRDEFAPDGITVRPLPVAADPRAGRFAAVERHRRRPRRGPGRPALHAARRDALRPRRARGRPRRRRRAARPADRCRGGGAGRRRRAGRRRAPHAAAALGLRHPPGGARPVPHRAPAALRRRGRARRTSCLRGPTPPDRSTRSGPSSPSPSTRSGTRTPPR